MHGTTERKAVVTLIVTFIIFMAAFAPGGLWVAGLICWGHFVIFVMPKSWLL